MFFLFRSASSLTSSTLASFLSHSFYFYLPLPVPLSIRLLFPAALCITLSQPNVLTSEHVSLSLLSTIPPLIAVKLMKWSTRITSSSHLCLTHSILIPSSRNPLCLNISILVSSFSPPTRLNLCISWFKTEI